MLNMLALLGWNDGSGQELFSLEELVLRFDLGRVNHSGAVFDFEKAKWYNHQYIQQMEPAALTPLVKPYFEAAGIETEDALLSQVVALVRERCSLLSDFTSQGSFFFRTPEHIDTAGILPKWKPEHAAFFEALAAKWMSGPLTSAAEAEESFNELVQAQALKKGEVMLPLRIMLVGGKYGPGVFDIVAAIGCPDAAARINLGLTRIRQAG
jgi:glutamyl-tRNA synthetase